MAKKPIKTKKLQHSRLGASSCERWWNCPGSVMMTAKYPTKPNKFMAEGTAAHEYAAKFLEGKKFRIKEVEEVDGFCIPVTDEMIEYAKEYAQFFRDMMTPSSLLLVEKRIELTEVNVVLFGTTDVGIVIPFKKIIIGDYKYGINKVDAYENKQMMYYALGLYLQYDAEEIEMIIYQPRAGEQGHITSHTLTAAQIEEFREELDKRVVAALSKKAKCVAGVWCKKTYCPAMAICPAVKEKIKEVARRDFGETLPIVGEMDVAQIRKVIEWSGFISEWMSKVKTYAKDMMLQGEKIPGYKVVTGLGNRKYTSEDNVINAFEARYGEDLYTKKLKSPAQVEKLVGKGKVDEFCFRPETGYKIVKDDNKSKAVEFVKAKDDFAKEL